MKCQRCRGNGKYKTMFGNTVMCDFCYGTGEIAYGEDDRIEPIGKKKPMTNEEWFCKLSTEKKAEFLNLIIRVGSYENEPKDFWKHVYGRGGDRGAKSIVEWLKQPHTIKE